jgi:serine/threonine-protein kinase RsbW
VAQAVREDAILALQAAEYDERHPGTRERRRRDSLETLVAAPLHSASGEVVGALWVASREPHWLTERRRSLVSGLAEQIGGALERARLDEALIARERAALLLARLTETLERATEPARRAEHAVGLLVDELVGFAAVYTRHPDGVSVTAARERHVRPAPATVAGLAVDAVASERTVWRALGDGGSLLALPLRARGQTLGALCVATGPDDRAAPGRDEAHLEEVADRIAISIDNALLYERERSVSHRLQLGLLGDELPPLPDIEVLPTYRPGAASLEVGGDWYDAFALPEGKIALVVGDVVGHGLDAAITMGQLRGAVRALAPLGGPADLLARLDEFADTIRGADSATLAYAELEPARGLLRYACAGHPPPFVLRADGRCEYLWSGRSTPIASSLLAARREAVERLEPGDTLGLYTDGLVERRGQSLELRLERLLRTASRSADASLAALSERVLETMLHHDPTDDDACLLLVRASAPTFAATIASTPSELGPLRHELRAWLTRVAAAEADRQEALLAVGEAVTNAVEHAYLGTPGGRIRVDARVAKGTLEVTVEDSGRWLRRPSDPDRGRGTRVMKALTDELSVTSGAAGTRVVMRKRLRAAPTA